MINSFLLLAFFTFLLVIRVERNNPYYIWLLLSIGSFLIAFFGYIQYIVGLATGYSINVEYFNEHSNIWVLMCNIRITPQNVVRMINLGALGFVFCFFSYAVLCTQETQIKPKRFPPVWSCVPILLALTLLDPFILRVLFNVARGMGWKWRKFSFYDFTEIMNWCIRIVVFGYAVFGYARLFRDYQKRAIKKAKRRIMVSMLCYMPITILYVLMFHWFPAQLISLRELHAIQQIEKTFVYKPFVQMSVQNKYHPLLVILSVLIFLMSMYFLGTKNVFQRNSYIQPNPAFRTATLQAKIFSHAIKNDLHSIKLLLADLAEVADHSAIDKIEDICNYNIDRMSRLRQTLDIIVINRTLVDVTACMENCLNKVVGITDISIRREYSREDILMAFSDETYLTEVFVCILSNAVEAIQHTGKPGEIAVLIKKRHNELCISISDNGCGVEEENLGKVFDMFYSTKPSSRNWGMGLAYCQRIIQLLNGEIIFSSVKGVGSCVSIYLPI